MNQTGFDFRNRSAAWILAAGLLCAAWTAGGAPVIRSGAEPGYPPLCFVDENGAASGFSVELLAAALREMSRKVSFETAPWTELKQQLAAGELDVLPMVGRTPEREALYDFTVPYLTLHGALFVHQDETAIQSLADLPGKTIAVMKGDNAEEYVLRTKLSDRIISTSTFEEAFRMLSKGEVDAVIAQKLMGVTLLKKTGITHVRVTGRPNEEFKQNFCFAVQEGNQALLAILNEGLALTVQDGTHQRLKQKWLGTAFYETTLARPLVYGGDRAFPPYEYLDENGEPAGFNIDLARALARELGVEISFHLGPWSEIRRKMDAGEIDLATMFYSKSRDHTVDFSIPLTAAEQVVFTRADSPAYRGLDSLQGQRIAVQNGDLAHDYLLQNGFSNELTVTQTPQDALRLLADGEVDFSASALLQGRYWIRQNRWNNVREVERSLFTTDYCFAVPEGQTALLSRINEGLLLLKQSREYQTIYNRWLGVLGSGMDWGQLRRLLLITIGALALAAVIVLWFFYLLQRLVRKKTAELRTANQELDVANTEALSGMEEALRANEKLELTQFALDSSSDTVFWIAPSGHFAFVNQAACEQLGYSSDELLAMSIADIDPDFLPESWPQQWQTMREEGSMRFESHHKTKDGRIFPVEVSASFIARDDEEYIFAFVHDITDRKEQQQALEEVNARLEENNRELQTARQAALNMMQDAVQARESLERNNQLQRSVIDVLHFHITDLQPFLDEALNEAIRLTDSKIGYIYFYDETEQQFILNSWSKDVMSECSVVHPQTCYELDKTGIWGEAVRQRKPILLNNFSAAHPKKKGLPKGHVSLDNFLTVPIFEHDRIVAVIGVANKPSDYHEQDILALQLFMDSVWKSAKDIKAQQALKDSEEMMRNSQSVAHICSYSTTLNGSEIEQSQWACSPEFYKLFGIDETYPHTIAGWAGFIHPDFRDEVVAYHESVVREKTFFSKEYKIIRIDDGEERWVHGTGELELDEKGVPIRMHGAIQDITDRKRIEQKIIEQKNLLNESQAAGHIGSWEYNIVEDRITWSDEMYRIAGREVGADLPGWEEMCSAFPQDWERLNAAMQGAIQGGTPYEEDFRILWPDGTVHWGRVQGSPVTDESGNIVRLIGTTQDITDRKKADEKIAFEQKLFKSFMDVIPAAVYFKDAEGTFINVNRAKCLELGLTAGEIIGKSDADFLPEAQTERSRADELRVMETEQVLEFEDRSHDRWFFSTKAPRYDERGNVAGILGISWDITSRKQAEAERNRLSTAIEQSPETVLITDIEGTIQYVNPAFTTVTGYAREEAIGQTPRILQSGKQSKAFYTEMWNTISGGKIWSGRIVNRRKDGSLYTEEAVISPVKAPDGTITNYVGIKRDVTAELAQKEQMQKVQKMEAVGQLAGGIAHDFNNILQAIMGFSELLMMQLNESDGTPHNYVREIQKAAKHAAELTRQLLSFSRKQEVTFKGENLNEIVQNTESLVGSVIGENVQMKLRLNPNPLPINADCQQIERSIMNMALNARDAMPGGGILTLQTKSVAFSVEEAAALPNARVGNFACLSIADTGTGMPKETVEHIFEPFFTTKEPGKGTGLGLAAIYGIIQEHKGWINVYSEPGKGSTFKIYLPLSQKPGSKTASAAKTKPLEATGAGERILVVEDDPSIQTLTEKALSKAGYQVECVLNAEEALKRFKEKDRPFSLLISDVILPGKTGAELAAELIGKHPDLPVILCSGYSGDRIADAGVNPGDFFFLEKPFQIADLLNLVHNILKGAR